MTRLLTAATLLVCVAVTPALAEPIPTATASFDFEDLDLGLVDPVEGLTLIDYNEVTGEGTGLKVTFDRISDTPNFVPPFLWSLPLEVADVGVPESGFGTRSLSPFLDTRAGIYFGYLRVTIDTSGLLGPYAGLQVLRMDWDMGDYFPSDNDDLYIASEATNGTTSGYRGYDNGAYTPPWGSQTYTLIRNGDITKVRMFGGTDEERNSVFYDNFVFSLYEIGSTFEDETPISSFGGGGIPLEKLGPTEGGGGGEGGALPIPEPGTFVAVALGLVALGAGARRKRRES